MKTWMVVTAAVVLVGLALFGSYVSAYNTAVDFETSIPASHKKLKSLLAGYRLSIKEQTGITSFQEQDLEKLFVAANSSRYGKDGSKAVLQMITEQNPNLDQQTYVRLIDAIQGGRKSFAAQQTEFLDMKRAYEKALRSFWTGKMMAVAGFPTIKLSDYNTVTETGVEEAFERGTEEPLLERKP